VANAVAAAEARTEETAAKLTPMRRRVLELICASHAPVGAYHLMEKLAGGANRRVAPPTVYRALDFLMEHGLIHRINSLNAYVACFGPHRPHDACLLICEQCKTVEEIEADGLRRAIHRKGADAGFEVRSQTIEVTGLCRSCRNAA
jgi:Fur family zinc uptake transcriptional regulator